MVGGRIGFTALAPAFLPANTPFSQPYIPKCNAALLIFAEKKSDKT